MRPPISPVKFYLFAALFGLILILIQYAVYRTLRRLYGRTTRQRKWLLALLVLANVPTLLVYGNFVLRISGHSPFLLRATASLQLSFSLIYLAYVASADLFFRLRQAWRRFRNARIAEPAPVSGEFDASRRRFLQKATAAFGGMAAVGTLSGFTLARGKPDIETIDVFHPELPQAFDGLTLVQLSDFHSGPYMSRDQLFRIRELAEGLNPDVFVLTGDFADSHPDQVPDVVAALKQLHGRTATYAILGNHDYYAGAEYVEKGLAEADLPLLKNQHAILENGGERIAFVGLDDRWAKRWYKDKGPNFEAATAGLPADAFRICLSHQPQLWPQCLRHGMHITLSGHTHGGQIGLPYTQLSLARMISPYVAGLYRRGENLLYVNRGLGTVGLPLRIGMTPEITLIRLRKGRKLG